MTRLVDKVHELASRYVYKAFDAVLTARVATIGDGGGRRGAVSNYRLVHLVVSLAGRYAPAALRRIERWLERYEHLPLGASSASLLSYGTGVTVFLLRSDDARPPVVLKVMRRSLGQRLHVLMAQMQDYRNRYRMVARWYDDCDLIVPLQFLILRGPLLGLPAIAAVQPYVGGERWDLFDYGTDAQLLALFRAHPSLREQFCRFASRTAAMVAEGARCVDFVGRDNLLLVSTPDGPRLQLIDFGVLDLQRLAVHSPALLTRARERLARVHRLHLALTDDTDVAGRAPLVRQEA